MTKQKVKIILNLGNLPEVPKPTILPQYAQKLDDLKARNGIPINPCFAKAPTNTFQVAWNKTLGMESAEAKIANCFGMEHFEKIGNTVKLRTNQNYTRNGYRYTTDNLGRVSNASGILEYKSHTGRGYYYKNINGKLATDHSGHLIADRFGASGDMDNLIAMHGKLNTGEWAKLEAEWASNISLGKKVEVSIKIDYGWLPMNNRPEYFEVKYQYGDSGIWNSVKFLNK